MLLLHTYKQATVSWVIVTLQRVLAEGVLTAGMLTACLLTACVLTACVFTTCVLTGVNLALWIQNIIELLWCQIHHTMDVAIISS